MSRPSHGFPNVWGIWLSGFPFFLMYCHGLSNTCEFEKKKKKEFIFKIITEKEDSASLKP